MANGNVPRGYTLYRHARCINTLRYQQTTPCMLLHNAKRIVRSTCSLLVQSRMRDFGLYTQSWNPMCQDHHDGFFPCLARYIRRGGECQALTESRQQGTTYYYTTASRNLTEYIITSIPTLPLMPIATPINQTCQRSTRTTVRRCGLTARWIMAIRLVHRREHLTINLKNPCPMSGGVQL